MTEWCWAWGLLRIVPGPVPASCRNPSAPHTAPGHPNPPPPRPRSQLGRASALCPRTHTHTHTHIHTSTHTHRTHNCARVYGGIVPFLFCYTHTHAHTQTQTHTHRQPLLLRLLPQLRHVVEGVVVAKGPDPNHPPVRQQRAPAVYVWGLGRRQGRRQEWTAGPGGVGFCTQARRATLAGGHWQRLQPIRSSAPPLPCAAPPRHRPLQPPCAALQASTHAPLTR